MQRYPSNVLSERETLKRALAGRSIARFGDGELRLAVGPPAKQCKTQEHHSRLQEELLSLLTGGTRSLICLPRLHRGLPNYERNWQSFYEKPKWSAMIAEAEYGSSFITRPDTVPDIDTTDYWDKMRKLWANKNVTLVIGQPGVDGKDYSLTANKVVGASNVRTIFGPQTNAYVMIDQIEKEIITSSFDAPRFLDCVILCLGATATCLAERLARRGIYALDLGHVGRFMRKSTTFDYKTIVNSVEGLHD